MSPVGIRSRDGIVPHSVFGEPPPFQREWMYLSTDIHWALKISSREINNYRDAYSVYPIIYLAKLP